MGLRFSETRVFRQVNMSGYIEREFDADIEKLPEVIDFVEGELNNADVSMKNVVQISIALEEIFVNVAHYAYTEGVGRVKVGVKVADGKISLRIEDNGVKFDPLERPDPDITLSAEERGIGGLGIFMVKKSMDEVTYSYEDGKNILTFSKNMT